ncbi:winged helix-turn-helix transcriptional regulator [bacterium]|nr:winged helix-turn-helix transcriptional regulator [bacterium]
MAGDERALTFAESSDVYGKILEALAEDEPIASGDLATKVGKSPQRISNVLGDMEAHGLISRHPVGRRTLIWLGGAGQYYLDRKSGVESSGRANKDIFDEKYSKAVDPWKRDAAPPTKTFGDLGALYGA